MEVEADYAKSKYFLDQVEQAREFLMGYLASHLLDDLTKVARKEGNVKEAGHLFCFSVFCNQRLTKLVACHRHKRDDAPDWSKFLENGSNLFLTCLGQLTNLSSLTIQDICTDKMLYVVSDTCTKLCALDISHSKVTDLGLVHLCGLAIPTYHTSTRIVQKPPQGCKYLRELRFKRAESMMPGVIAYLLRHLKNLQIAQVPNLYEGIQHYGHTGEGSYRPRPGSIPALNLTHFSGADDKLPTVIGTCPKLRTFSLNVTDGETLSRAATVIASKASSIESLTLVFRHLTLVGLPDFLARCGQRINALEIHNEAEEEEETAARITPSDLREIADNCPLLDTLVFQDVSFELGDNETLQSLLRPLKMRFLTSLKLINVQVAEKEMIKYVMCGCPDLETFHLVFKSKSSYFFNDFFLDEILTRNPMGRLQEFVQANGCLTLISGLRLFSSRPKLRTLGDLTKWDVEASEMETFLDILLKAKSMNLLQHDVTIF